MVGRHHAALAVGGELGAVDIGEDLGRGAEIGDEARRLGALVLDGAQAPRMIGAISAALAVALAICRAWKTTGRPCRKRLSASDTISIMRS